MSRKHEPREEVYAILRADLFHGPDVAVEHAVYVKAIVYDRDVAVREVERLNELNADKGRGTGGR